jgi:hypothetical protein
MFERFRRGRDGHVDPERGGVATTESPRTERAAVADRPAAAAPVRDRGPVAGETQRDRQVRGRDEFGGINWGAAFFGFLVAVGMGTILTALLGAAGAAVGLTQGVSDDELTESVDTVGIVGGALLLAVLMLAYYCGGYVAGRMSRFDGARQGFGVWAIALVVAILLAVAGALFGSEYNVLAQLDLPRIPVEEGSLATGGAIALALIVLGTLVAAIAGGRVGQRYHRRVDRTVLP